MFKLYPLRFDAILECSIQEMATRYNPTPTSPPPHPTPPHYAAYAPVVSAIPVASSTSWKQE